MKIDTFWKHFWEVNGP